jgi:hypothetical protein
MKPYREILKFVVVHIAEIRSSVIGRGLEPDVPLLFLKCFDSRLKCVHRNRFQV